MSPAHRRAAGFTLIELMVTLAIGAVLMLVAAPSFVEYRRNAELSDAAQSFVLAAGSARATALKSGRNVFVQATDTTAGWTSGWIVYSDNNWNSAYNAGTDDLIMQHEPLSTSVAASPTSSTTLAEGYLMFNGAGFPRTTAGAAANGTLQFTNGSRSTNLIVDNSGRVRSCKAGTAGCS